MHSHPSVFRHMFVRGGVGRWAHALRVLALLLLLIAPLQVRAQACGGEGQPGCPFWVKFPSCNANLVERHGLCVRLDCGQLDQRACGAFERLPSCDPGLAEFAGRCFVWGACGAQGQRPCTLVERPQSCDANLVEHDRLCIRLPCGRADERVCQLTERLPSCDEGLVEYAGQCRLRGACGAEGQRPCLFYERSPACAAGLIEDNGVCRRIVCGREAERSCSILESPHPCGAGLLEHHGKCVVPGACGAQGQRSCVPSEKPTPCDPPFEDQQGLCQVAFGAKMTLAVHAGFAQVGPLRLVRVDAGGAVRVGPINGMLENDATDAEFRKQRGLADANCLSFESTKFPGRYLRHLGGNVVLRSPPFFSPAFAAAATFCLSTPQGGPRLAYEAYSRRGYYLYAMDDGLFLQPVDYQSSYPVDYDAATLHEINGPATLFLTHQLGLSATALALRQGDYQVVTHTGPCAPPWSWLAILTGQKPVPSEVEWLLRYHGKELQGQVPPEQTRWVNSQAVSGPLFRLAPWIRFSIPVREGMSLLETDGPVAKIQTGSLPCGGGNGLLQTLP
jgi:hypothetical protein